MLLSRSGLIASAGEIDAPATITYAPTAAVFDGATDALYRIGASDADALTGAVDGKLFSCSFTVKRLALSGNAVFPRIVGGQIAAINTKWAIGFEPSDHATVSRRDCLFVEIRTASSTTTIAYFNSTIPFVVGTTYRVGVSVDRATRTYQLRVDNIDRLATPITDVTDTSHNIDFTTQIYSVGCRLGALTPTFDSRLNAELTDLSVYFDKAIDWADAAEWAKHFEASTHALQWKANDGSRPHGHPIIYLSGDPIERWHVNRGSGHGSGATPANNTFALSGTLAASSSPPTGAAIPQFELSDVTLIVNTANSVVHVQGSDNWPLAWASDGNLITSWGDGSEPRTLNNPDPTSTRCSLGFARITSATYAAFHANHDIGVFHAVASSRNDSARGSTLNAPIAVSDINFAAGTMLPSGSAGGGKCYAIQALPGGVLYALVGSQTSSDGVSNTATDQAKNVTLLKSTNNGLNWTHVSGVSWDTDPFDYGWAWPTTINFGRANGAAQDEYLYWYAGLSRYTSVPDSTFFTPCTDVMLVRVLVGSVETKTAYECFTGMSGSTPLWSTNFANRAAVPGLSQAGANQLPNFFYLSEFDEIICIRNTNGDGGLDVTKPTNLQFLRSTSRRPWGPFESKKIFSGWKPYDLGAGGEAAVSRGMFFFSVAPKWLLPSTGSTTRSVAGALTYTGRPHSGAGVYYDAWNSVGMTLTLNPGAAPPPSLTLEAVDSSAEQIAITVGSTERQTWEGYGWGAGSPADAATVAPIISGSSARTQALFEDLNSKIIRLNNPQEGGFIANCKPLTDYAATHGVDRLLATGYVWQNINNGGSFTPTLLADAVHAAINGGIPITHVSLQNEPDGGGSNGPPTSYAVDLRAHHIELRNRLNALGRNSVKVIGLEWAHCDALTNGQVDEYAVLNASPSLIPGTVAQGAGHIYADGFAPDLYDVGVRWGSTTAGRVAGLWSCETGSAASPSAQARTLSQLNNGASAEIFHQGHADAVDTPGTFDDSQKLMRFDGTVQPWWAAMSVLFRDLPRGSIFRLCTSSDRPGSAAQPISGFGALATQAADRMYRRNQGALGSTSNVYPRIQVAAARRPDDSWIVLGVNSTDGAGNNTPNNLSACYPAARLQMTVTIPERSTTTLELTTRRASKAGVITEGTVNMVNGVVRFTLAAGETIAITG